MLSKSYNGIALWWWCQGAMAVMTIVNLYIVCCMIRFVWRGGVQRSQKHQVCYDRSTEITMLSTTEAVPRRRRFGSPRGKNKYKKWMNYLCVMAASQNLLKLGLDQVKFFHAWNARSDSVCERWYDVTDIFLFGGVVYCVYGFLWMKQWVFYQNPVVEAILYSRRLIIFSKIFVVVIMIISPFLTVTNAIATRYKAGNSSMAWSDVEGLKSDTSYLGCVSIYDVNNVRESWALLAYVAVASIFQAVLLGLFLLPLIRERIGKYNTQKERSVKHKSMFSRLCGIAGSKNNSLSQEKGVEPIGGHDPKVGAVALNSIRRAIFWASLCVVTDVTTVGIFAQMGNGNPLILVAVVTDLDLLINVLCVVATYSKWREILFPFSSCLKL